VYSTDNTTTTKAKGVVIGVLQRDKCRDSWHYDINQIYNWRRQYVYHTNITISTVNDGVFNWIDSYDNDDVLRRDKHSAKYSTVHYVYCTHTVHNKIRGDENKIIVFDIVDIGGTVTLTLR